MRDLSPAHAGGGDFQPGVLPAGLALGIRVQQTLAVRVLSDTQPWRYSQDTRSLCLEQLGTKPGACWQAATVSAAAQVLSDPRQKRFFKSKDMRDLFTLGGDHADASESATIFAGLDSQIAMEPASEPASREGAPSLVA